MWLHAVLLLGLAGADVPTVALLPFSGEKKVERAQTRKLDRWLRRSMQTSPDAVRLLPGTKRDANDARRCGMDAKCLSDLAYVRGADAIAAGRWKLDAGNLVLQAIVVEPQEKIPPRSFEITVATDQIDSDWMAQRIWRSAFVPETLRGSLWISGAPDGAVIEVDGVDVGTLPLENAIDNVLVGERRVTLRKKGYRELEKSVTIQFERQTDARFVLVALPVDMTPLAANANAEKAAKDWMPWALGGTGLGLVSAGVATGLSALWFQQEVEKRAAKQLLYFPRDEKLIQSGQALAWTTNVLWGIGVLACVGAGVWMGWEMNADPGDVEEAP